MAVLLILAWLVLPIPFYWHNSCIKGIVQLNLAISNSVNSKSPLFQASFDHHLVLTRLFRNPAISNLFSCPVGLWNSGVRLYYPYILETFTIIPFSAVTILGHIKDFVTGASNKTSGMSETPFSGFLGYRHSNVTDKKGGLTKSIEPSSPPLSRSAPAMTIVTFSMILVSARKIISNWLWSHFCAGPRWRMMCNMTNTNQLCANAWKHYVSIFICGLQIDLQWKTDVSTDNYLQATNGKVCWFVHGIVVFWGAIFWPD